MKQNYDAALARLLVHEGGYTNHPSDPGGPTNFGITIADYRRYVKPNATATDVKAMKIEEAKSIYRSRYWDAQRCDDLPAGVDYAMFDYGVNSGIGRSKPVLQRCCGVAADGVVGEETIKAVQSRDSTALINAICDERLAFLKRLKTWPVFGAGWGRRVAEVRAAALSMAAREPASPPPAAAADKACAPTASGKQKIAAGAIAAAGAGAALQAHGHGAGFAWAITIAAAVAMIAIAAWLLWRRRRIPDSDRTGDSR